MKVIVTGSLGHIGRPLTIELIKKGHAVTVISSSSERKSEIESLGATAAIGQMKDPGFLTSVFTGADLVYCMIPPTLEAEPDRIAFYRSIAGSYAQAIKQAGVKRVIHLSTYGADLDKGTGILMGAHFAEGIFNNLPEVSVTHIRPTYFYYNLLNFIGMIKARGVMAANYGGKDRIAMVSPVDIAFAIAEEIAAPAAKHKIRYVSSDEHTGDEVAGILGEAIGKPDLKWVMITDEEVQKGMEAHGVPNILAAGLVEMYASLRKGDLSRDYYLNHPKVLGKVKLEDYAKDFAAAYNKK